MPVSLDDAGHSGLLFLALTTPHSQHSFIHLLNFIAARLIFNI